jgi:hypothetical protein
MEKGKNFSCNNLGQRKKSDFYETPYSITQQFLDVEKQNLRGVILEPAAGNGAIVKVLKKNGLNAIAEDIATGDNFLERKKAGPIDCIITNPPFSLAFEFIQKAKSPEIGANYFALLLPLSYLHGKKRFDAIYSDKEFPLSRIYVFTRYPLLGQVLREDGKYNTGMMVYAWFVWDKSTVGKEPVIRWLDNNHNVLSKGE